MLQPIDEIHRFDALWPVPCYASMRLMIEPAHIPLSFIFLLENPYLETMRRLFLSGKARR